MKSSEVNGQTHASILKRYLPILNWLPRYPREWLRLDIIAGITVWGTTVPTAMGYAQIAGLPVQMGLYAAMVALIAYAIFGSSSLLKVETSPSMAIMSAVIVSQLAQGNYADYITLSAALAVVVGVILVVAGLARMGFLADFLAKPVVVGFLFGLALIVIIQQIPILFGITTSQGSGIIQLWDLFTSLNDAHLLTFAISAATFGLLLLFRRFFPRYPGTLFVMGISVLVVFIFNLDELGINLVGTIPRGLPTLSIPLVSPSDILFLALGGIAVVFVALGESLGTARSFAAEHHNRIDADQELIALGTANLSAGLLQGFAVGGNPSTTSASNTAKSKSQVAALVTAAILIVTLLTRVDLIGNLPQAVVSVAVILSVSHLLHSGLLRRFYKTRRIDFTLAMVALLGVLVAGVFPGLLIAVFLSLLIVLYRSSQPRLSVLGKIPGHEAYGDIDENPEAEQYPKILILRPNVPLFFANANLMHSQIRKLVLSSTEPLKAIIVDLSSSEELDIAVTDMLMNLVEELEQAGIRFLVADAKSSTLSQLENSGLVKRIGEDKIYLRVPEAVEAVAGMNPLSSKKK
jgi:high affinity sulfate transporter 1